MPSAAIRTFKGTPVIPDELVNKSYVDAIVGGGIWSVLGDYEAAIAEASHEFDITDVDFDDDSTVVVVIDGTNTASLNLLLRVNQNATNSYFLDGSRITGGAQTILDNNGVSAFTIIELTAADRKINAIVWIGATKGGTTDRIQFMCSAIDQVPRITYSGGILNVDLETLTHIEILTSTSTWKIGTRITVYKVARA